MTMYKSYSGSIIVRIVSGLNDYINNFGGRVHAERFHTNLG